MSKAYKNQFGFSIVELMVAIALVMIISAGILTIFINSSRSFNEDERYARMMENGRYALSVLSKDLKMADFWGEMVTTPPTAGYGIGEDCDTDLMTPDAALLYYHSAAGTPNFNPTSSGCGGVIGALRANTDAVAIKRVANEFATSPVDGTLYLQTNGVTGTLVNDAGSNPGPADTENWRYMQHLYYIRNSADNVPYLCRTNISTSGSPYSVTATSEADECLAEGIEQMRIEFGIDTNTDGIANEYKADITTDEQEEAVTARIYLLARSILPTVGYTNDKVYNLGGLALGPFNDNFYRRVFSITVSLRNPTSHLTLK